MIRTTVKVYRQEWTKYSDDCPRGSGYCEDQGVKMTLRKRTYLGFVRIRDEVLAEEDMPSWAWIQTACLGSTDWECSLYGDSRITQ